MITIEATGPCDTKIEIFGDEHSAEVKIWQGGDLVSLTANDWRQLVVQARSMLAVVENKLPDYDDLDDSELYDRSAKL